MPRLENWSIVSIGSSYQAPECVFKRLHGNIYDDSRFDDGTFVATSRLQSIDIKNNTAQTLNTTYTLGKPSEDYLNWLTEQEKN